MFLICVTAATAHLYWDGLQFNPERKAAIVYFDLKEAFAVLDKLRFAEEMPLNHRAFILEV